eukprot:gene46738-24003_t
MCPTSCRDDAGCQPFHQCVFPTVADLERTFDTAASASACDPVTG